VELTSILITNAPTKIIPIMAKNTMVATTRTGLNIYGGIGFSKGGQRGLRLFTHHLELCFEADQESSSSQGNDGPDGK